MNRDVPNSVIGAVSSVIAAHYYKHSELDTLFMESGAPGDAPAGNCEKKCSDWLKRCNNDASVDGLLILGEVIQDYMEMEPSSFGVQKDVKKGQDRIIKALVKNQLSYQINGQVVLAGANPTTKTLIDFLKSGDLVSIDKEFERALKNIDRDPHASITAACSIIEALCKIYIESFELTMPNTQTVVPLWKAVKQHLKLNSNGLLADDQNGIVRGLSSVVDGIGAFRTHIGSAHGRGKSPPTIKVSEARLAVNASHTLVVFILERWHTNA
ncbi:hypothetical protein MS2017_2118 [Bathymodiolus thermophilus thioautotrophic gill symbiont]|uniref:Abortive infection protein-like C-terminal domain-containing protein n=1 Tax=Bathymodiolus thermophilus thioautotrophic gill symbiont TaxID=2360 RepID=A0A3G3IPQ7_9GAMM|nr:abortive infection family protein [Bathymodiolus thermophilus thioautotrophic gill symbiont]AYQ57770.1 hypothetical protein MS2017_2118 [Bathymodiolus thermophilus thioautotrophic gill symbiont]